MYKEDLALNDLQWLICQKAKPKQTNLKYVAAPGAFAEFVKVTNLTGLWDAIFAWYSLNDTCWICLNDFIFTQPLRSGRIWHKVNF